MDPKWLLVFIFPCIGLAFEVAGIRMLMDGSEEAADRRRRGAVLAGVGIVFIVVAGLTGAFMSL